MTHIKTIRGLLIVVAITIVYAVTTPVALADNLLENPGAEEGDLSGWTVIEQSGLGWTVDFDGYVRSGSYSFQPSFTIGRLSQTVDLLEAANMSQDRFDDEEPATTFSMYVLSRPDQDARYYFTFKLLAADGTTELASSGDEYGSPSDPIEIDAGTDWFEVSHTFNNYPNGVQYAYFEFGGSDQSGWAGSYGAHFDDASLTLNFDNDNDTRSSRPRTNAHTRVRNLLKIGKTDAAQALIDQFPRVFANQKIDNGTLVTIESVATSTPTQQLLVQSTLSATHITFTRDLEIGMSGDDVKQLQEILIAKNIGLAATALAEEGATGYFGHLTQAALIEYQQANGISPATGYFGPQTKASMS